MLRGTYYSCYTHTIILAECIMNTEILLSIFYKTIFMTRINNFYRLAADGREYCFAKDIFFSCFLILRINIFFPDTHQKLMGCDTLSFSKCLLVIEKRNKMSFFRRIF